MVHTPLQQLVPPPIFVRSTIKFELFGNHYHFESEGVSTFGASGLRCQHFDPIENVGTETKAFISVHSSQPFTFSTQAMITAEATVDNVYLGLKFTLGENIRAQLEDSIRREGYYPTNYLRKYPRIPARDVVPSMPLRAIVATTDDELIVFDIANMSPGGVLLYTENPKAAYLIPGVRITAQVEPRGNTHRSFDFDGIICRMMMDLNSETRNMKRYLGIKFTYIAEDERENFVAILKDVLQYIQKEGLAKGGLTDP